MKKKSCVRARVLKFSLTWRHEREKLSHKGISSLEIVKKKGGKKIPYVSFVTLERHFFTETIYTRR